MATTTANAGSADTGQPFAAALSFANIGLGAFQTYEAAQVSKKAVAGLTPQTLTVVILGVGALAVVALFVFKH